MTAKQRFVGKVVVSLFIALLLLPGFVLAMLRSFGQDEFAIGIGVTAAFWLIRAAWQDYESESRRNSREHV